MPEPQDTPPGTETIRTQYAQGRLTTQITYYPTADAIPPDQYRLWVEFVRRVMDGAPDETTPLATASTSSGAP